MYGSVAAIFSSDDPFLECRQRLAGYVCNFADFNVLCLTSEELLQLDTGDVRRSPYISGELHQFIRACSKHNEELIGYISRSEQQHCSSTDKDLVLWARARSCAFRYYMNCMNIIRLDVNDLPRERDWFRPFVRSMLIWKEDDYRSKIGLKTLLPAHPDALAWRHSTFLTCVGEGALDPLARWETAHELRHEDVSSFRRISWYPYQVVRIWQKWLSRRSKMPDK
jgi:hypothetical protein